MVRIGTTVYFEAAHRQLNDPSKCGKLHGHNWKVDVEIESDDMKLNVQKELASMTDTPKQVLTPPVEPQGRAPNGMAFQR